MSTFSIVCVRDQVAGVYHQPMFFINDAAAVRAFRVECTREGSMISASPGDYDLYRIGEYSDDSGSLSPATASVLCHGRDVPRPA